MRLALRLVFIPDRYFRTFFVIKIKPFLIFHNVYLEIGNKFVKFNAIFPVIYFYGEGRGCKLIMWGGEGECKWLMWEGKGDVNGL